MLTVFRSAGRSLLLLPLTLAALAGCQDGELPTGVVRAPDAPRFSLQLPATTPGTLVAWGSNGWRQLDGIPAGSDFVAVAGGEFHSVALRSNGTLVSWGRDDVGQVSQTPAGSDFVAIASGGLHNLALRSNGTIVSFPGAVSPPEGSDFIAVAAGGTHGLALRSDGSLISWGSDDFDQVSDSPDGSDFVAVAAGDLHSVALRSDGSLVSWGSDKFNQVTDTPEGSDFVAVAGGWHYSLALRSDGSLISWGNDFFGQVSQTPAGNGFVAIAAGHNHGTALRSDGSLVSWGANLPSDPPAGSDFVAVAAGSFHGLAIRTAPAACEGVQIRMTRTAGPDAIAPGASGAWTVKLEVSACEAVTKVSAQGGTVGWATTSAATSDGTIGVRKANRNSEVLLWEIGAMAAGDVATAVLTVNGTVGKKAACGTTLGIASDWSATAVAGGNAKKYGAAGPITVDVCEPPPPTLAAPVAQDDEYSLIAGETLNVLAAAGLLANDVLGSPAATITAVLGADGEPLGDRTILEGVVAVDPATGAFTLTGATRAGTESFQYDLTNSEGTSRAAVTITVKPGAAALMLAYLGDGQFAAPGATLLVAPAVRVTDAWDNVIAAASVTFAVSGGGGSVTVPAATTSSEGIAAVGSWTLGADAGVNTLEATSTGLTPEIFKATAVAGCTGGTAATAVFSAISDPVRNTLELTETRSVTLLVIDACGTPVPDVAVAWAAMGNPFSSSDGVTGGSMTGPDGNATASWTYHYTCGTRTVSATVEGLPAVQHPLSFGSCGSGGTPIRR